MIKKLLIFLELIKFNIALFVALSTTVGFILASDTINFFILVPVIGVLFLACGSAVLNQYQERDRDALMTRTKKRPLPCGKISPQSALKISLILIFFGSVILLMGTNFYLFCLGLLAVFWYNGVYTNLKLVTPFAVVPGGLVGSIPPVIGWIAGGGTVSDPKILIFAFFLFIWQIPHFWLLLLIYGKEYDQAGFPSLVSIFSQEQLGRITFVWILAAAVTCLLIPLFGLINFYLLNYILIASAFWMMWTATKILANNRKNFSCGYVFRGINIYALNVMITVSINKLLIIY